MNSDVISIDNEMIEKSNAIYGNNRIDYLLFVVGMCGNEQTYNSGNLEEVTHSQVTYDVTQNFPEDDLVAALKSTQTELAQVHGAPSKFQYCQFPFGVELILSKMQSVNAANIMAGINKRLLKAYDAKSYVGVGKNTGIVANPKGNERSLVWATNWATFKPHFDSTMVLLRDATDITSSSYSNVQFCYTSEIGNVLNEADNYNVSNMEKLQKAYPNVLMREIPSTLEKTKTVFTLSYTPMLTFHRGALPSIDAQDSGKYNKSLDTLFAFESTAVEVETNGALQRVTLTV